MDVTGADVGSTAEAGEHDEAAARGAGARGPSAGARRRERRRRETREEILDAARRIVIESGALSHGP